MRSLVLACCIFSSVLATSPLNAASLPELLRVTDGPVLLQFWASWCHRCSTLFSELAAFTEDHSNLHYIAVNIDKNPDDAKAYLNKHAAIIAPLKHITFKNDTDGTLTTHFQVTSVPEIILISSDGDVLARSNGHISKKDLFRIGKLVDATKKGVTH